MINLQNNSITRVTGGSGGEVYLITGREGAAVIDCGMAFCAEKLIANIREILGERPLDFALISHTHYDHIGGIPFLRKAWPEITILGESHGKKTLQKASAQEMIRELSENAAVMFGGEPPSYDSVDMAIDETVKDGDIIDLGNIQIEVVKVPGHTKCSLAFFLRNESILFASETSGVLDAGEIVPEYLTGYKDSVESIRKCKALHAKYIVCPHYGPVEDAMAAVFWDTALKAMETSRDFILKFHRDGYNNGEILQRYVKKFRSDLSQRQQPLDAFEMNAEKTIAVVIKEFGEKEQQFNQ